MSAKLEISREGEVVRLTLADPQRRNPLSSSTLVALADAIRDASADPSTRVILLTAQGPSFCAGLDLDEAASSSMADATRALVDVIRLILASPLPVVVRLHGPARAGALGLLCAADVVVADPGADLALPEVRIGVVPAVISTVVIDRVGGAAASLLMLAGRPMTAGQAADAGLVGVVAPEALDDAVAAVIDDLLRGDREAIALTKQLMRRDLIARLDRDRDELAALSTELFARRRG